MLEYKLKLYPTLASEVVEGVIVWARAHPPAELRVYSYTAPEKASACHIVRIAEGLAQQRRHEGVAAHSTRKQAGKSIWRFIDCMASDCA